MNFSNENVFIFPQRLKILGSGNVKKEKRKRRRIKFAARRCAGNSVAQTSPVRCK